MKKEICWDEEEEELRERRKKVARAEYSSSDSESETSDSEGTRRPVRQRRRRRRKRQWRKGSGGQGLSVAGGDVSETLYETEYPSEYDPSQVQSEPEEAGWSTPPPRLELPRDAYSTPRVPIRHRRHSSRITDKTITKLGKKLSTPITELGKRISAPIAELGNKLPFPVDEQDKELPVPINNLDKEPPIPINAPRTDEGSDVDSGGFVSGYDSASEYLSGPGECVRPRYPNSDSDHLEHIGSPDFPLVDSGPGSPDLLSPPPPISPSQFDENLPVISVNENQKETVDQVGIKQDFEKGASCSAKPVTDEGSCDTSCDPHVTSTGNTYTNITYVTYCTGHSTCSSYCPSQYFNAHHHPPQCHYRHNTPSHPPHFSTTPHHSNTSFSYCHSSLQKHITPETVLNRVSPETVTKMVDTAFVQKSIHPEIVQEMVNFGTAHKPVDPDFVPYSVNAETVHNQVYPEYNQTTPNAQPAVTKKRKMDTERSDRLPDGTEPRLKKQCY